MPPWLTRPRGQLDEFGSSDSIIPGGQLEDALSGELVARKSAAGRILVITELKFEFSIKSSCSKLFGFIVIFDQRKFALAINSASLEFSTSSL